MVSSVKFRKAVRTLYGPFRAEARILKTQCHLSGLWTPKVLEMAVDLMEAGRWEAGLREASLWSCRLIYHPCCLKNGFFLNQYSLNI